MICDNCYHLIDCKKSPDEDGRCNEYLKDGDVEINEDVDVNPINTETFDYDDIKRLFGDILCFDLCQTEISRRYIFFRVDRATAAGQMTSESKKGLRFLAVTP